MLKEKFLKKLRILPPFPKVAGSSKEFRDWDIHLKETYPTRYAINEKVEHIYNHCFLFPAWRLRDWKWDMLHRFHPKHKYNVVKTSLEPGYYDACDRILFAMGDEFHRFFKRIEDGNSHTIWDYTDSKPDPQHGMTQEYIDERQQLWLDMCELNEWWVNRPTREDALPKLPDIPEEWGLLAIFNDDFRDTPEVEEWRRVSDLHHEMEAEWKRVDEQRLHKIIEIREYLWD